MRTLGEQLKKARLDRGMQRTEVAFTLGVDPTTVRNWEENRTQPAPRHRSALIEFLDWPFAWADPPGLSPWRSQPGVVDMLWPSP